MRSHRVSPENASPKSEGTQYLSEARLSAGANLRWATAFATTLDPRDLVRPIGVEGRTGLDSGSLKVTNESCAPRAPRFFENMPRSHERLGLRQLPVLHV